MKNDGAAARCDEATDTRVDALELVRSLLAEGRAEDVLALFAKLLADNTTLQRQLAEAVRRRFKSRETVNAAQLLLLFANLQETQQDQERPEPLSQADEDLRNAAELDTLTDDSEDKPKPEKPRKHRKRRPFPKDLRRVANPILVPEERRPCPCCENERECIGYEVTETLELIPAELVVRLDKREKLACRTCDGELCRAPQADKLIEKGRLGVQLVSCMLVEKYRDGLPLHRQLERFERLGISLPLSTLVDQVGHCASALKPLHEAAIEDALASHVMHVDGTGMPVLDKAHPKGTRYGTLWGYVGDEAVVVFLYGSTGKKIGQQDGEIGPEEFLNRREGLTVADASNIFEASFRREELIECGCNAHSRRKFIKAMDGGDSRASLPLGAYRRLYEIEREGKDLSLDERTKLRQDKSKPIFDALLKWCQAYKLHEPPSSPLGEALRYFTNHHEALGRFLEDGAIPIDNSLIERQHVRVALTRKNFLFVGSDEGGHRAAVIYTLLGSCALNDVDPVAYLADVLVRVARGVTPEQARELLPHRWKAACASA